MKDPYVQDNGTLKNKLNISDSKVLYVKELEYSSIRMFELFSGKKNLKRTYDLQHLKNIHKYIFNDVYDWAGKIRNVDIAKGNTLFCKTINIENYSENIFSELKRKNFFINNSKEELAHNLAKTFLDINALHPFREGNGRTQREFIRELAEDRGYNLSFNNITKDQMIELSIKDDPKKLAQVFFNNMEKIQEKEIENPFEKFLKEKETPLPENKISDSWEDKVSKDNSLTLGDD